MRCKLLAPAAIAALVASLALGGCGEGGGLSSTPGGNVPLATPTPVGIQTPAAGTAYLGTYVALNSVSQTIYNLEKTINRRFAMDVHYVDWVSLFPNAAESGDLANGRLPLDSWDCGASDADIVSGAEDPLIVTRAQAIKAFGHPVFLRFMYDMNTGSSTTYRAQCYDPATDNSDGTFSATEFIAAWDHIRTVFAQQGVNNVVWVWNVSSTGVDPTQYYPGASEVDWIGIDAFDTTGTGLTGSLSASYAKLASYGKPILVETGESTPSQPAFFQTAASTLQSTFPDVKALLYDDGNTGTVFFAINTAASTSALTTMGASPFFSAFGSL